MSSNSLWEWNPQPDITAYELALALPILFRLYKNFANVPYDLPAEVKRHFKEVPMESDYTILTCEGVYDEE